MKKTANNLVALKYLYGEQEFLVDWYIGKRCNLDCSYCGPDIHDNKSSHANFNKMKDLVDKVSFRHGDNVIWSLTGGEPTLHPNFLDLCKYIKESYGSKIYVTTNGTRQLSYFTDLFQYIDSLVISIHFEELREKVFDIQDRIINLENWRKAWNLKNKKEKKNLIARMMAPPGEFDKLSSIYNKLTTEAVERVEVRAIKGSTYNKSTKEIISHNTERYTEEEKKQLIKYMQTETQANLITFYSDQNTFSSENSSYNSLILNKMNSFKGWYCYAGVDHIKINPDGDVYRGSCLVGGILGNIYTNADWSIPSKPFTCTKKYCGNLLDLRSSKVKELKYSELITPQTKSTH